MAERPRSAVFVGRSAELSVLSGLVAQVASGRGGVAWVEGESGIGKSALVAVGLAEARNLGCAIFSGVADQLRARFPLGVLLDCLEVDSRSLAGGTDERAEIAGLLRGEGTGGPGSAGDAVAAAAKRILSLVDRLCAASGVVLVVDDLQWADDASVSVWHRLTRAVGQVPLLMVGVSRPVPKSPGLVVARRSIMDRGGAVMSLRPLPPDEVKAMIAGLVGARPGPGLLAQAKRAGGNPMYVRELTEALVREDLVRVTGGLAEVTGGQGGAPVPGPVSLAAAIEGRLGFLSAATLEALRAAALLEQRFSVRDLRIVDGRSARELAVVVSEAVAAGVLTESGMDLVFRHGLIQQALGEGLPAGMRAELHRDAARALAAAGAAAERVAAQLLAAGAELDEWTIGWLAASANVLVHRAPRAAADLLALAVREAAAEDPRREALMEHLAGVLIVLARYEQAEPLARELLDGTHDPGRRTRLAWTLASTLSRAGRRAEALTVIDQALLSANLADAWTARLRAARAQALVLDSHDEEAGIAAAQALADAERAGDGFAAGSALHVQSVLCLRRGDQVEGLERTERALTVIGDDPQSTDLRLSWRCRGLADGDPAPVEHAVAHFRGMNEPLQLGEALEDLAVVRAAAGDLAGARAALGEAAGIYAELGAEWDLLRADSRLRPYGVRRRRAGQARPQTGWKALTSTETKVAYLVGQGLSNPEIGARLFLSRYTVQVHVSRILAKLQVRSRVEVASQVARHQAGGNDPGVRATA